MPPFPPIVHDEVPEEATQFVRWLGSQFGPGVYHLEVTGPSDGGFGLAPLVREGSWVFQIGDRVFTIWEDKP
jgi:hypothetical protein